MTRTIPIPALVQEGMKVLEDFPEDYSWMENGNKCNFSFSVSGRSIEILMKDGPIASWAPTNFIHMVEIFPRERMAFFYNGVRSKDQSKVIERTLRNRGYVLEEKDCSWFSKDYREKFAV